MPVSLRTPVPGALPRLAPAVPHQPSERDRSVDATVRPTPLPAAVRRMDRPGIRRAARRGRAGQGEDKVSAPYTGYTIEAGIPFSVLPDAIDPQRMGFDVLVHDSDTQDLSSQSRLGWSTFTGLRADPYR